MVLPKGRVRELLGCLKKVHQSSSKLIKNKQKVWWIAFTQRNWWMSSSGAWEWVRFQRSHCTVFLHWLYFVTTELHCHWVDCRMYGIGECWLLPSHHAVSCTASEKDTNSTELSCELDPLQNVIISSVAHVTLFHRVLWKLLGRFCTILLLKSTNQPHKNHTLRGKGNKTQPETFRVCRTQQAPSTAVHMG